MAQPRISVVIPAFNEERSIGATLESLCLQQTGEPFEVIVVDNNSTDRTADAVRAFAGRLNVRVIEEKRKGRGIARRTGCAAASGDLLFCSDADTILPPDWIATYVHLVDQNPSAGAVSGVCRITDSSPMKNFTHNTIVPFFMRGYRVLMGHYWLSGCNCAVRRSVYDQAGGFSNTLDAQEDVDLAKRIVKFSNVLFVPTMVVTVSGRRFKNGLMRGLFTYLSNFIHVFFFKKHVRLDNPR